MRGLVKKTKKAVAIALAAALMLPNIPVIPVFAAPAAPGAYAQGAQEAAYMEWDSISEAAGYQVYVKKAAASDSAYQMLDDQLIRRYEDGWRADAVGLSEGAYTMKVVPYATDGEAIIDEVIESDSLSVSAYDRSGFAFSSNSTFKTGSGAYNDDGTLKSNAQVIYITPETAKTVTLDVITSAKGATTKCVGIGAILTARGKGFDTTPLDMRFIGKVTSSDMAGQLNSSGYLQVKGKANYAEMNMTLEGIGEDATAYGWGFLIRYCGNVEVRNFGLMLFPDDGISMDTGNANIWVHNNDILYGSAGGDADQAKGDGSCDLKNDSKYLTMSYNHFWDSGKCSLCGMTSETGENYITYHHNWFDHSDSRHPRIRTMSVHVYNNYYDGNSKYGVGVTSGASALVENNYFRNCKYPMMSSLQGTDNFYGKNGQTFSGESGGMIKAFNNYIEGATRYVDQSYSTTDFDAITVASRTETVPATYKTIVGQSVYNNFDTKVDLGVSPSAIDDTMDVVAVVTASAGRMNGGDFNWTFNNAVDDTDSSVNKELMAAIRSYDNEIVFVGGAVTGNGGTTPVETTTKAQETTPQATTPQETSSQGSTEPQNQPTGSAFAHNFTADGVSSSFYSISGNLATDKGTVSYNGLTLTKCLKVETATTISFTSAADSVLTLVFNSDFAKGIKIDGTKYTASAGLLTVELAAGTHQITKGDTTNIYYMSVSTQGGEEPTSEQPTSEEVTSEQPTSEEATSVQPTTPEETTASIEVPDVVDGDIFVAASANGDGSLENPTNLQSALKAVKPGNTIWMLAGNYRINETIVIAEANSGTAGAYKTISAYDGSVVLDFSGQALDPANRGVILDGSYWHMYGITFKGSGDNGMLLSGDNNIIEMCVFTENRDTGLQLSRYNTAYNKISEWPSNNLIKNCTAFNNCDAVGENADGFAAKLTCGEGNVFDGCMSYNNSDDGWDLFAKSETGPIGVITIKNSIAFRNGKLTTGAGSAQGDMNGFKLGGSGIGTPHVVINCLAFENGAHGFTDNNNPTAILLQNCTSYTNSIYSGSNKCNFQMNREDGGINSNLLSFTTTAIGSDSFIGTMESSVYYNSKKYYVANALTAIAKGQKLTEITAPKASDFVSTTAPSTAVDFHTAWRDADGTINTHGFLQVAESSNFASMATDKGSLGARLSGDANTVVEPVTTPAETTKPAETTTPAETTSAAPQTVVTAFNVSTDMSAVTLTETVYVNGFAIHASEKANIVVDASAKSADGFKFTNRLKFGGSGSAESRSIQFQTAGASQVVVYAMSSSSTEDRTLVLSNGSEVIGQGVASKSTLAKVIFNIEEAGTYSLYSETSGINVYYVSVTNQVALPNDGGDDNGEEETSTEPIAATLYIIHTDGTAKNAGGKVEEVNGVLTATAHDGYRFAGWYQVSGAYEKFVTDADSTVLAEGEVAIAKFVSVSNYTVRFMSNGTIVDSVLVADGECVAVTNEIPVSAGYTFTGWAYDFSQAVVADMDITAVFEKNVTMCALTVINATADAEEYEEGTAVRVRAAAELDGMTFSYWLVNGVKVNMPRNYEFSIIQNTTVEAVFEGEVEAEVSVVIKNAPVVDVKAAKITFVVNRVVPAKYTVASHGILLTNNASVGESEDSFIIGTTDVIKGAGSGTASIGTFEAAKGKVAAGETWYGRGYVIYKDAQGNQFTVYGNIQSASLN